MSNQEEILTIDSTEDYEMGEALLRLTKNPDFRKVVIDGYLKNSVLDSVSLLAVPSQRNERVNIMEDLIAASNLQQYFAFLMNRHAGCVDPILSDAEESKLEKSEGGH